MTDNAITTIKLRNNFYQDNYRKITIALLAVIFLVALLASALVYVMTHPPKPQYFATTADGRITQLMPLNQPNLSSSALLEWANTAAVAVFSYNFVNYRQALQAASDYFTTEGWKTFLGALQDSRNLTAVLDKKLIVSGVATGAPVILEQGLLMDRYTWKVQMPMLITYQSASQFSQQSVTVTMLIVRVSTLSSARGIAITQFIVTGSGSISG